METEAVECAVPETLPGSWGDTTGFGSFSSCAAPIEAGRVGRDRDWSDSDSICSIRRCDCSMLRCISSMRCCDERSSRTSVCSSAIWLDCRRIVVFAFCNSFSMLNIRLSCEPRTRPIVWKLPEIVRTSHRKSSPSSSSSPRALFKRLMGANAKLREQKSRSIVSLHCFTRIKAVVVGNLRHPSRRNHPFDKLVLFRTVLLALKFQMTFVDDPEAVQQNWAGT